MEFTININDLRADSLREFDEYPLASDSHERRVLYFFFRGLEEMAIAQYDRMAVYVAFGETIFPEEQAELDVLAAELARSGGDHAQAFARYQARLARFLQSKQGAARGLGLAFAPRDRFQLLVRDTVVRLMGLPRVTDLAMGRSFHDSIELPAFSPV